MPVPIEKILGQAGFGKKEQARDARRLLDGPAGHLNISIDNRELNDRLDNLKEIASSTERNTHLLKSGQEVHTRKLNEIIQFAKTNKADIMRLFDQIDALSDADSIDLERIDALLEDRLDSLVEKLPSSSQIVQEWKEANFKSADQADLKWKLKFKLPFILGELEKEFSWDGKAALRLLRSEILAFSKGEKHSGNCF